MSYPPRPRLLLEFPPASVFPFIYCLEYICASVLCPHIAKFNQSVRNKQSKQKQIKSKWLHGQCKLLISNTHANHTSGYRRAQAVP